MDSAAQSTIPTADELRVLTLRCLSLYMNRGVARVQPLAAVGGAGSNFAIDEVLDLSHSFAIGDSVADSRVTSVLDSLFDEIAGGIDILEYGFSATIHRVYEAAVSCCKAIQKAVDFISSRAKEVLSDAVRLAFLSSSQASKTLADYEEFWVIELHGKPSTQLRDQCNSNFRDDLTLLSGEVFAARDLNGDEAIIGAPVSQQELPPVWREGVPGLIDRIANAPNQVSAEIRQATAVTSSAAPSELLDLNAGLRADRAWSLVPNSILFGFLGVAASQLLSWDSALAPVLGFVCFSLPYLTALLVANGIESPGILEE